MSVSSFPHPATFHTMVDDSMEIASEQSNIFEEDIDIDIDLTTGHFDEDDILDDVDADAGFDTNIVDVPAQIETDDLMVDDDHDDASYYMQDADLLDEEADDHNMEQEPAGSFATDHLSDNSFNEKHPAVWHDSQVVHQSDEAANAQDPEATIHGSENVIDSANDYNPKDTQELAPASFPRSPTDQEDTQPNSPQNLNYDDYNAERLEKELLGPTDPVEAIDPNTYAEDEEHVDPNTTFNENGPYHNNAHAEDQEQEHPDLNTASNDSGSIDQNNATFESSKYLDDQNHACEIVVKYNNRTYPLIRKCSTDHPSQYFFMDPSIIENPFNEFLSAIRKVLSEDNVPDDDKISLVIEELQLVIQETQLADYPDDFSLAKVIHLYEKLVNNDGTGDVPPLNLTLFFQQSGPNRFLALSKGAAEGKGLLNYATLDADSDDDPTEFGERTGHYESESPVDEDNSEPEEGEQSFEASDIQDENSNTELVPDSRDEESHLEHLNSATSASAEASQGEQGEFQEVNDRQSAPEEVRQFPGKLQELGDVDEDGDFIDYEDEDIETPTNNGASKYKLPETDESKLHNEEKSYRKSISLRQQSLVDELNHQHGEETTGPDEATQPNETFQDVESDIDYEEENAEEAEHTNGNLDAGQEQGTAPNGSENAEHVIDLNDANDDDREYTLYNDNNEIEQHGDGTGRDVADYALHESHDDYNETDEDGGGEGSVLADNTLEADNVEISFDSDLDNGEQQNFEEDEFDLGVGDEEETHFLRSYQLDHDAGLHGNNQFLGMSVGENTTTTKITFNETAVETDSATLSNASVTETQEMKPGVANGQDQEDEIDYDDDDDYEEDPPSPEVVVQPPTPTSQELPASTSGKRPRAETDFEDGDDSVTNETKRIRS